MSTNGYQFALLLYKKDGTLLGQAPIAVDWEPAAEWTRLEALRRGLEAPAGRAAASVLPLWNSRRAKATSTGRWPTLRPRPTLRPPIPPIPAPQRTARAPPSPPRS